jgi:hypothetical protein
MISNIERACNLGSAATLVGDQKFLFIFVDDDGADRWTIDLRQPVETKIERSLRWLEDKGRALEIELHFQHACLPLGSAVACNAGGRIDEADYCAGPGHSTWQNRVVSGLTSFGSVASRWNDLFKVGGLSLNSTEGSAVFFCVRRWVPSVAFPFFKGQDIEFEKERAIIYDNAGARIPLLVRLVGARVLRILLCVQRTIARNAAVLDPPVKLYGPLSLRLSLLGELLL